MKRHKLVALFAVGCCMFSVAWGQATETRALVSTNTPGVYTYSQPPTGFNPINASDSDLEKYGYPPRPDSVAAPQNYKVWAHIVGPSKRITNPQLIDTGITNGPATAIASAASTNSSPISNATATTSSNWSGYVINATNGTFVVNNIITYMQYVVPPAQQAFGVCSSTPTHVSIWTGFDGYGTADVLQAGIEDIASCSGGTTSPSYYAWYEWYPNNEVEISGVSVAPGQTIGVTVWYTTASPHGNAYLINYSNQESTTLSFNPPSGTTFVGNSIEWIAETPTSGGSVTSLTNYVSIPSVWTYAFAGSTSYYPGSSPVGTIYSLSLVPTGSTNPVSYADLFGNFSLGFFDEDVAECVPTTSCQNAGTDATN